jgi:protein TonB
MFSELIESKPKKQRSPASAAFSVVLHVVLAIGAVYATSRAGEVIEKAKQEDIAFVETKKEEPPPPEEKQAPPPPEVAAAPPPPKGFQVLTAPIDIPDVIPDIDLTKSITNEADFSGIGVAGGVATGKVGGTGEVTDAPLFEFQVEKPAMAAPGTKGPEYPGILRQTNVQGRVIATFVVDTSGRADMTTFRELESAHDLFTLAVKNALPKMRFLPAEVGGRKVKMWVQQAFEFKLDK